MNNPERHRTNRTTGEVLSDCTQCHFANTTKPFSLNASLYVNDHNLTIIRSFYQYNLTGAGDPLAGMPLASNGGAGVGTFPYYSCTMASCHSHANLKIENASQTWVQSNHAKSLRMSGDNKQSCAKCKSPLNYNVSLPTGTLIAQPDWQGINCRVCHNLHNRSYSPGAGPIAFYNATQSSTVGYDVYDKVVNATELCEKCHTGGSHDSKFGGTHKNTFNFTCVTCHMNTSSKSFNFQNHTFEVTNVTSGEIGCEVCHKAEDHTFSYTPNHTGKATCEACHDKTVSRNATGYAITGTYPTSGYGLWNDTATGMVSSYKLSHSAPATWPLHNISKEVNCAKCHGTKDASTNLLIVGPSLAHTNTGTCDECHIVTPGSGFTLPLTQSCKVCHTTYADLYGAPNLTGTSMGGYTQCGGGSNCHGVSGTTSIVTLADHEINRTYPNPTKPVAYTVFLNGVNNLIITSGTPVVTIRSNISDSNVAGKVAGAQYQVKNSTGAIVVDWTAMNAVDGTFNAVNGVKEAVNATMVTTGLNAGTYTVYVRGLDIGKQWSDTQTASLIIGAPTGFVNGTIRNGTSGGQVIRDVTVTAGTVSVLTDEFGNYSLSLPTGTYTLTATKDPEYYSISIPGVNVTAPGTTPLDIVMNQKPTGTVAGRVSSV
jgi:hypothetical protein